MSSFYLEDINGIFVAFNAADKRYIFFRKWNYNSVFVITHTTYGPLHAGKRYIWSDFYIGVINSMCVSKQSRQISKTRFLYILIHSKIL